MIRKKASALLLTLCLLLLAACSSGAGVSSACIGYAAGEEEASLLWCADESFVPPIEFVRALAILCAVEKDAAIGESELPARIVYDYDDAYMRSLLERCSSDPDAWIDVMNARAASIGMTGTRFSSLSGVPDNESALRAAFSLPAKEHTPNTSTLKDLFLLGRALYNNAAVRALFAGYSTAFAGSSREKTRNIPLLRPSSDLYLPDARMALGGWCKNDGSARYVLLTAAESGDKTAFAAVASRTDTGDALLYAAVDAGNLCGKCLDKQYELNYLPSGEQDGGGMVDPSGILIKAILIVLALLLLLALILILVGAIVRFKRNRDGRRKYLSQDENR